MTDAPPSRTALVLAAIAAVLLALSAAHFSVHTGDDGFIFLRYAERFARGQGLGFTDGVPPLEGFSSPIWVLLLSVLIAFGVPSLWAAKLLSAVSLGALLAGMWALVRTLGGRPGHAAAALLILALLRPPLFWAFSGLETPLAAATLCWTAWGLARGGGGFAAPAGLLAWVRPEGPAMAIGAVLLATIRDRRPPSFVALILSLGPAIGLLAARWSIYGELLPNTFYAKANAPLLEQISRGAQYGGVAAVVLIGLIVAAWFSRAEAEQADETRAWIGPLGLAALQIAVVIGGGGDWMWFSRLLVPVMPLLIVGCVVLASRYQGVPRLAAGASAAGLLLWITPPDTWTDALQFRPLPTEAWQEGQMTPAEAAAGRFIAAHGQAGDLVAVNHAGAMPWAAPEQRILDMTGLLDAHIARSAEGGLHAKYDVDYVFDSEPDWIVLHTRSPPDEDGGIVEANYWVGETALLEDPRFNDVFKPTGAVFAWDWAASDRSYTVVYQRR